MDSQNGGCLPSRPALPNSPGTVLALSGVSKEQGWGGCCFVYLFIYLFIKILDWQFTIVKIEIEKLKFTIDDKYMAYV